MRPARSVTPEQEREYIQSMISGRALHRDELAAFRTE